MTAFATRDFERQVDRTKTLARLADLFPDAMMINPYLIEESIMLSLMYNDLKHSVCRSLIDQVSQCDLLHRDDTFEPRRLANFVFKQGGEVEAQRWHKNILPLCRTILLDLISDIRFSLPEGVEEVFVGTKIPTRCFKSDPEQLEDFIWRTDENNEDVFKQFTPSKDDMFILDNESSQVFFGRLTITLCLPVTYCTKRKSKTIRIPLVGITLLAPDQDPWRRFRPESYRFGKGMIRTCNLQSYTFLNLLLNIKKLESTRMHAAGFFAAFAYLYEVADQRATNIAQRLRVLEAWDIADEATAPKGEAFLREVSRRVVAAAEALSAATTRAEGYLPPLHRVYRAPQGLRPAQRVRVRGAYEAGPTYCALRGLEVANHVLEFDNGHFALPHFAFLLNLRHVYRATVDAIALSHTYGDEMSEVSFVTATVLENVY